MGRDLLAEKLVHHPRKQGFPGLICNLVFLYHLDMIQDVVPVFLNFPVLFILYDGVSGRRIRDWVRRVRKKETHVACRHW